jgi:hypothetical protein
MNEKIAAYLKSLEILKTNFAIGINDIVQEYNDILDTKQAYLSENDKMRLDHIDEIIRAWNKNTVMPVFNTYNSLVKEGVNDLPSPEDYFINKERK